MNYKEKIMNLISEFNGKVSLYATDGFNNEIRINENNIVETASCIKVFILVELYRQILYGEKNLNDMLIYDKKADYVENGSGLIQYLDGLTLSVKNMAILMIIVSDNIATNKLIEYLGVEKINNTIKSLGFDNTQLVSKKLDFTMYNSIGKTTVYEYAQIYKLLLNKEILTPNLCDEIINILSMQTKNDMLVLKLSPKELEEKGTNEGFIKYIATKSGGLGDEGKSDITNCRNDGGIISTKYGDYIISIFISDFTDHYFYINNPATQLGSEISKILFETFKDNKGSFKI